MAEPTSINVAFRLAEFAAREPDRAAVIVARTGKQFTFRELHADSDALAHGLIAAGITRGTRVAVMVPPSLDFFSLVFALFKVAAVPAGFSDGRSEASP
jgi:acyl-CoA synthetase (AMP-forming)/AMP-acid ligase II